MGSSVPRVAVPLCLLLQGGSVDVKNPENPRNCGIMVYMGVYKVSGPHRDLKKVGLSDSTPCRVSSVSSGNCHLEQGSETAGRGFSGTSHLTLAACRDAAGVRELL